MELSGLPVSTIRFVQIIVLFAGENVGDDGFIRYTTSELLAEIYRTANTHPIVNDLLLELGVRVPVDVISATAEFQDPEVVMQLTSALMSLESQLAMAGMLDHGSEKCLKLPKTRYVEV